MALKGNVYIFVCKGWRVRTQTSLWSLQTLERWCMHWSQVWRQTHDTDALCYCNQSDCDPISTLTAGNYTNSPQWLELWFDLIIYTSVRKCQALQGLLVTLRTALINWPYMVRHEFKDLQELLCPLTTGGSPDKRFLVVPTSRLKTFTMTKQVVCSGTILSV